MRRIHFSKDWSKKPTYAEVELFKKYVDLENLIKDNCSINVSFNTYLCVFSLGRITEKSSKEWLDTHLSLTNYYPYYSDCPVYIQDWFNHTYDLTLLLEE